jgi:3'(2'), 5'-bisphosphate nucleotidase
MRPDGITGLVTLAVEAGRKILEVYGTDFAVERKADSSPITRADRESHAVLLAGLAALFPDIPVLSEEGELPGFEMRRGWRRMFLVDPLDGTKEFAARNGEFAVCVGLVEDGRPTFGLVHLPAQDRLYYGGRGLGSYRIAGPGADGAPVPIVCRPPAPGAGHRVVVSRSHPSAGLDDYLRTIPVASVRQVGSACKFCLLAEGEADLYPRLTPGTWEWDTAAGHALVEGAGGSMTALDGGPFPYNKPSLMNGPYLASA